jgi:membrane fusion protein, copper/silver efflux system
MIVGDTSLSNHKTLNGRLAINPEKTVYVSSRVAGRIDVLPVRETGVKIAKGQQLFGIFSEELAALQQEYIVTVAQVEQFPNDDKFRDIEKGARQKLLLYGQSSAQITRLKQTRKTEPYVTFASPVNGVVAELSVTQGQYVNEGDAIMRIENYDHLWVEADLYPSEAAAVKVGLIADVRVAAGGDKPVKMKIEFISPNIGEGSQVSQVRGSISNPKNLFQPGMQALINVPFGTRQQVLTLPASAVIRDGKGTHAWVQVAKGKFEPRMVKTGTENSNEIEIVQGIERGERVVVTGAYLLYSEYILKKGSDPIATHNH